MSGRSRQVRMGRATADQRPGPHPVRPVPMPDLRELRAGRGNEPGPRRQRLLLAPRAAVDRPRHPARRPADGQGLGPAASRDATGNDGGQRARTDRLLRRRSGRGDRRSRLEAGRSLDVVEHHFLVATSAVTYDWIRSGIWFTLGTGNDKEWFHPLGTFMDRFTANEHGLLLLHARGNAFIRDLDDGERIYIRQGADLQGPVRVDECPLGTTLFGQPSLASDPDGAPGRTRPDRDPVQVRLRA